jgi:hypothetical protein
VSFSALELMVRQVQTRTAFGTLNSKKGHPHLFSCSHTGVRSDNVFDNTQIQEQSYMILPNHVSILLNHDC